MVSTFAPTQGFIVTAGPFQNWEGLTAQQATSSSGRKPWAGPSYVRLQARSQRARPAHLCKGPATTDRRGRVALGGITKPTWGTVPRTHGAWRLHRTGHLLFFLMLQGAYKEVLSMAGLKTFHFKPWSHLQTCAGPVGPEPAVYLGSPGPQGLAMGVGGGWIPYCKALPKLGRLERFHPAGKIHRDQVIGVFMHFCQPRADPQDTSPGTLCNQHDHGVQMHSCRCFLGSHHSGTLYAIEQGLLTSGQTRLPWEHWEPRAPRLPRNDTH